MALRSFSDEQGTEWQVWNIQPQSFGSPATKGRKLAHAGGADEEALVPEPAPPAQELLTPGLEEGWLCFESATEKRRLHPIPPGWEAEDDEVLQALCRRAEPVGPRT